MVTVRKITAELRVNAPEHIIITGGCLWDCSSGRLIEFREDKVIFGNAMAPDGTELKNIPVDGQLYDLVINGGMTEVYRGNILLAKEKGIVVLDR